MKSANRVSGAITIAARPLGKAPQPANVHEGIPTVEPDEPDGVPTWPELLAYYSDIVRAEIGRPPLMDVRSASYVVVTEHERALCGVLDDDGCLPLPLGADHLVRQTSLDDATTLWMGWPAVVLYPSGPRGRSTSPQFAPLLIRQVEIMHSESGIRLRPDGPVMPHTGLAAAQLGEADADRLASTYLASWHRGEYERMAHDAGHLMMNELGLPCIQELRPQLLEPTIDLATSGEGGRNCAVLFSITAQDHYTRGLLKDLEHIRAHPTDIERTALAALYPHSAEPAPDQPSSDAASEIVTPVLANPAQRAVIHRAIRRRLSVVTGPPGTGKSQLVVDTVATAISAGQRVLVASTNNRAVDEIHERCERIMPGLVVRTGSTKELETEAKGLAALLTPAPPGPSTETRRAAFRHALQKRREVERQLADTARREVDLLAIARAKELLERRLGCTAAELSGRLGNDWGTRARALASAWFFGEQRRRNFLAAAGLAPNDSTATCKELAELASLARRWRDSVDAADSAPDDSTLAHTLGQVEQATATRSADLIVGHVRDLAGQGRRPIEELQRCSRRRNREWNVADRALAYLPAWALTSLSAQRFRTRPALFDLVIIDEASQCSIPSVVPLLFRARRALVIGDAMQLPHITSVNRDVDARLRARWKVSRDWLGQHHLSPVQHSAFAAAEEAAGGALLLDEHYRCHPAIAGVSNRLFYHGALTVLTNVNAFGRVAIGGPPLEWRQVEGAARRGRNGRSWRNDREVDAVTACVLELLASLPLTATIGVVTPYRAQCDEIDARLQSHHDRVRVGTAHAFQGGERDVIVLSLVAARNERPQVFDWADQQPELWNVAITRARSKLIIVGDEQVWAERGGIGGELLRTTRSADGVPLPLPTLTEDDTQRLYEVLTALELGEVELGVAVHGHRADAVVDGRADRPSRPLLLDAGPPGGVDPAAHLRQVLDRVALLGADAVRIPAWRLFDDPRWLEKQLIE